MAVEFRLLGSVEARVDGEPIELGPPRQRAVLAILLAEPNRTVTIGQLEARLWYEPPQRARKTLHSYISRLRSLLADCPDIEITRQAGGYTAKVDPRHVDLHRFRDMLDHARRVTGRDRLRLLDRAMDMSVGGICDGLDLPWANMMRTHIEAERSAAVLDRNDALLAANQPARLCAELAATHDPSSLDERLAGQYMLALWRSGRQADALAEFRRLRTALVERLGTEPGDPIIELHRRILQGESETREVDGQIERPVPRQLPAAPRGFIGRDHELSIMDSMVGRIGVVTGAGGIGKTWLVGHWAHRSIDLFPDGQLYVNMRGFDTGDTAASATMVLKRLLDALGVSGESIPASLDARSSLFRSVVAGKRLLLVLDNVRDSAHVEPLLPGAAEATTIVISRHHLTDLVATMAATPVVVEPMPDTDAMAMLIGRLGARRVEAESVAAAELVRYCAGLPLALGVLAARATTRPSAPIADLVRELADRRSRLDALSPGRLSVGIRTTLETSLHVLKPPARDLFTLLGAAPSGGLAVEAVASLAGVSISITRRYLDELEDAHLIEHCRDGLYRMHDLVHLYASELAADAGKAVAQPLRRLVDHFSLGCTVKPRMAPVGVEKIQPAADVHAPCVDGPAVFGWLTQQYGNLLGLLPTIAEHGWYTQLLVLANCLYRFQEWMCHAEDTHISLAYMSQAADHLDDPRIDGHLTRTRGEHRYRMGDVAGAVSQLRRAVEQADAMGDRVMRMSAVQVLAWVYNREGQSREAVAAATEIMMLIRASDPAPLAASAHHLLGWCLAHAGEYAVAAAHCEQALLLLDHGPVHETGEIHGTLGYIADRQENLTGSLTAYGRAISVFAADGAVVDQAKALTARGAVHHRRGDMTAGRRDWMTAARLLRDRMLPGAAGQVGRELVSLS